MSFIQNRTSRKAASFSFGNRFKRLVWGITYQALIRYSPTSLRIYRIHIYRIFGAIVADTANIYPKARVWAPWNLVLGDHCCLANDVNIYNQAKVTLESHALISQGAHICTGTHDYESVQFNLIAKPILIGRHVWVASEAFVGPGVKIGEGTVVGARAVVFKDLEEWTVYSGNPAKIIKKREKEEFWKE